MLGIRLYSCAPHNAIWYVFNDYLWKSYLVCLPHVFLNVKKIIQKKVTFSCVELGDYQII